ncbi:MAG: ABC transporter permease [Acidimicrobiales bacterium]
MPAALGVTFLAVPLVGLLQRAPWSTIVERLTTPAVLDAVRVSAVVSVCATIAAAVLGLPLAWLLARTTGPVATVLRVLVMLPMVLPPVVGGTALLFALGRRGLFGGWLDGAGIQLPFTTAGAVVAATFVALPFFVTTVDAALRQGDGALEEAAAACGAGPWATFVHVTVPTLRPAIVAGAALSWARALGEFGATVTFAGSLGGRTRTLPLETFLALEQDPDTAIAVSVLLLAMSLGVLVALRGRWLVR